MFVALILATLYFFRILESYSAIDLDLLKFE